MCYNFYMPLGNERSVV